MSRALPLGLILGMLAVFVGSCLWGGAGFAWPGLHARSDGLASLLVLQVRLPRALTALLVGSALGASGAALQGLFRNPLADPSILGVSGFAACAAQLTIFLGWAGRYPWALPIAAALGALAAMGLLLRLLGAARYGTLELLILGGVALGQVALALSALVTSLALRDFTTAQRLLAWMLGSLDGRTWMHVLWGLGPIIACVGWLVFRARALDGLCLGDATAHSLGVDVVPLRREIVVAAAILSGVSVAIGGVVGFVGLMAPHFARRCGAQNHAQVVSLSALLGALFVLGADWLSRVLIAPAEIQIGVLTAALGAPWFVLILRARFREGLS
jgi:iron complex transport system permease protein